MSELPGEDSPIRLERDTGLINMAELTIRPVEASERDTWNRLFQGYADFYKVEITDEIMDNVWSLSTRAVNCHRDTSNPLNSPLGQPPGGVLDNAYRELDENGAFGSEHSGGANFSFGDGRVEFISDNIDMNVYQALSTRAGGEVIGVIEEP